MPNFFRTAAGFALGGPIGGAYAYNQQQRASQRSSQQQIQGQMGELQGLNWDPNTFMPTNLGHAPTANQANDVDWQSQQLYQQAKNRYFTDALGSNQQALSTLGGYRSGGAASAASGILQNRSSLQFNIGNSLERPDVFANARVAAQNAALSAQKQAANKQLMGGIIGGVAGVAGMAMGGAPAMGAMMGGGAAMGAAMGSQMGQQGGQGAGAGAAFGAQRGAQVGAQGGNGAPGAPPLSGGPEGGGGGQQSAAARLGGGGGGGGGRGAGPEQVASATPLAPEAEAFNAGAMHLIQMNDSFYDHLNQAIDSYGYRLPNYYQGAA